MAPLLLLLILGVLFGCWLAALQWTAPRPDQDRRRVILALAAAALGLLIVLFVASFITLEVRSDSAAAESSEFGAGWGFAAVVFSGPLFVLDAALFAEAGLAGRSTGLRACGSLLFAVVVGTAVWVGLWTVILGS